MRVSVFSKTIGELQRQQRGEPITARHLNQSVDALNTMLRGAQGPRQIIASPRPSAGEPAIAVVLVEAPDEESSILKIRRVKYEADPPVAEQYAWDGDEFDAYPAFGLTVGDFVGLEWTSAAAPESDGATFLKARLVDGSWLVDKPGGLLVVAQFQLTNTPPVRADWVLAWMLDDVGGQEFKIAKPYLLRERTFDGRVRNGIRYEATGNGKRTATRLGTSPPEEEKQVIVEQYLHSDRLYATAHVKGGTGVSTGDPPQPLLWLDDNRDGRAWAAEFQGEASSA